MVTAFVVARILSLILVLAGYQKDADAEADHSIRGLAKNSPEAAPRFQHHVVGGRF